MPEQDYTQLFRKEFGREPSLRDIKDIEGVLIKRASEGGFNFTVGESLSLDAVIGDHQKAIEKTYDGFNLSNEEIRDIIVEIANNEKKEKKEKAKRDLDRIVFYDKVKKGFVRFLTVGLVIGTALGAATGSYFAVNSGVNKYNAERYKSKQVELEKKFYGPLDSLTSISEPTSLTHLESKLYAKAYLGIEFVDQFEDKTNIVYDKTINGVHIIAKEIPSNSRDHKPGQTIILKMGQEDRISEIHTYEDGVFSSNYPSSSLIFSGDSIKLIDYANEKSRVMDKEGKIILKESILNDRDKDHAEQVMKDYQDLKQRGPYYTTENNI